MKFNYKVALICFAPYIPLIVLYLVTHIFIANKIIALLVAFAFFSAFYIFIHYKFSKPFFKQHPELDPQHFEFNTVANVVFALWFVVFIGLVIFNLYPESPVGYLLAFGLYYATTNGFKTYRGQTT